MFLRFALLLYAKNNSGESFEADLHNVQWKKILKTVGKKKKKKNWEMSRGKVARVCVCVYVFGHKDTMHEVDF